LACLPLIFSALFEKLTMDYKNTLNLPRTDFAMKADLVTREPARLAKWEKENLYAKIQKARKGAPKFVLHDGPPFANGDVHVGTALNKILKDIIVKYKTLRGYDAPYVPGWDCHGLPIESKVTQELRAAGNTSADAATIRTACDAYARKYIGIQREQFKRLGVFGDWDNPYLTLNKEYEADELRMFADIVEKGFVYRGKKPVYWSIPFKTALAEAEVEYNDHVSQSVYVKFRVKGEPNTFVLIWTTTPWTLPANLAVAFNPALFYSLVHANGESYFVCISLLEAVSAKCKWESHQIIRTVEGDELSRLEYEHPFCNRTGKLHPANFVTSETGTGFVHIAPGHGADDYNLGRSVGLPIYSPVDDNGCLAHTSDLPVEQQIPAEMVGKSILEKHGKSDANEAVLHALRVRHALLHQENYHHSYPHCWRSKTPIIFRAMDQWFIKVDHVPGSARGPRAEVGGSPTDLLPRAAATDRPAACAPPTFRQSALSAINGVKWVPDWGMNRIKGAVESRPDWCISRQRTWGVPIPAFYDKDGNAILDAQIVRNVATLVEKEGSNVWFAKGAAELWSLVKPADWKGADAVAKSNDTLDVWIDSGSSSRSVLMRRAELQHEVGSSRCEDQGQPSGLSLPWQADIYLEGSDQHRGWFQSSLLLSLAGNGAAPFKTVLTHGFMVDEDREKISKSKQGAGAYTKPQTADRYIKDYGADVLRLWVASQDYRNDIVVSEERLKKVSETYRGIRNCLRYQLSNLYDFDPAKHAVPDDQLTRLDRGTLGDFADLENEVMGTWTRLEDCGEPREQQNQQDNTVIDLNAAREDKRGYFDRYEFHVVYQKVSQFVAVELSAFYHDVIKDRMYTHATDSAHRRSSQIALYRMVTGLCDMLSPILTFTADEVYECVPSVTETSVHIATWKKQGINLSEGEKLEWRAIKKLRDPVLQELEKARQAKVIGKALEAKVIWQVDSQTRQWAADNLVTLREVFNVSSIDLAESKRSAVTEISCMVILNPLTGRAVETRTNLSAPSPFEVTHADGQKCERCWHWETDVGQHADHPTLCGRCVEAVKAAG
jgi:isoleucyl-tRNA synthetase